MSDSKDIMNAQNINDKVVTNEYNKLQAQQTGIDNAYTTKKRLTEINQSYYSKLSSWIYMIIILVIALAICGIVLYFREMSPALVDFIIIIILAITIIWIYFIYVDMLRRDPINYDELLLEPPAGAKITSGAVENTIPDPNNITVSTKATTIQCANEGCCLIGVTVWDSNNNSCRPVCATSSTWNSSSKTCVASS